MPLTNQTENMIGADFYSLLKPNAILINTARGGLFSNLDDMYSAFALQFEYREFPEKLFCGHLKERQCE